MGEQTWKPLRARRVSIDATGVHRLANQLRITRRWLVAVVATMLALGVAVPAHSVTNAAQRPAAVALPALAAPAAGLGDLGTDFKIQIVGERPPGSIAVTGGGGPSGAWVAVTQQQDWHSGEPFGFHRGTSYSYGTCQLNGSPSVTNQYSARVDYYNGNSSRTTNIVHTHCPERYHAVALFAKFKWGEPFERFAENNYSVNIFLPGYAGYDDIVSEGGYDYGPESAFVAAVAGQLASKYGPTAECVELTAGIRSNALYKSTVSDAYIVCESKGIADALRFGMRASSAKSALEAAFGALQGPAHDSRAVQPECDSIDSVGNCIDDSGTPPLNPQPQPEPQPEPGGGTIGGGRVPPRANCLDPAARQLLEDSMPQQYHHMATHYGAWGEEFQDIVQTYGLDVEDAARAWNVFQIPHRGPHPQEYHQWALDNMQEADRQAQGDVAVFKSLFNAWVVDVVKEDPTIVRLAYWKCYR